MSRLVMKCKCDEDEMIVYFEEWFEVNQNMLKSDVVSCRRCSRKYGYSIRIETELLNEPLETPHDHS